MEGGRGVMASFRKGSIWMVVERKPTPPEGKGKDMEGKSN